VDSVARLLELVEKNSGVAPAAREVVRDANHQWDRAGYGG